jgi:hypothetical protein
MSGEQTSLSFQGSADSTVDVGLRRLVLSRQKT